MPIRLASFVLLSVLATASAGAQSFRGIGFPSGNTTTYPTGLSDDGEVIVGETGFAFWWSAATGFRTLEPTGTGPLFADVYGVNGDGSVAVGMSREARFSATVWRISGAGISASLLSETGNEDSRSEAYDVSADGTVVAGYVRGEFDPSNTGHETRAIRWANGTPFVLPAFGREEGYATAVSRDGSTLVGHVRSPGPDNAAVWGGAGTQVIGTLPGGTLSRAMDVDSTGQVVVGWSNSSGFSREAFRWTPDGGMQSLGVPPGYSLSEAWTVSADGSVIGGYLNNFFAAIWTEDEGWRLLSDILTELGLSEEIEGWRLTRINAISADGMTIAGVGLNPTNQTEAFLATLTDVSPDLVVNQTSDEANPQASMDEDRCDVDRSASGNQCTLRAALEVANAREGTVNIEFDLDPGAETILVTAALPAVGDSVRIVAEPRASGARSARVHGNDLAEDGLVLTGVGSSVEGLAISGFRGAGIVLRQAPGLLVEACYVGTDVAGHGAAPNGVGVLVEAADAIVRDALLSGNLKPPGSPGGGSVSEEEVGTGLLIRGEGASGTVVERTRVGLNAAGDAALPNAIGVAVVDAPGASIGTETEPVWVSGNAVPQGAEPPEAVADLRGLGVLVRGEEAVGVRVLSAVIGLDEEGAVSIPNAVGVLIDGAPGVQIGLPAAGNVISGHQEVVGVPPSTDGRMRLADVYGSGVAVIGASGVRVEGNVLGLSVDGSEGIGNGIGVLSLGASDLVVSAGTIIARRSGVYLDALASQEPTSNAMVVDNAIGVLPSGQVPEPGIREGAGVAVRRSVGAQIGGPNAGNTISGWDVGVRVFGAPDSAAVGTRIAGNRIGLDPSGMGPRPNTGGVWVEGSASGTRVGGWEVGERNLIGGGARETSVGVAVTEGIGDGSTGEPTGTIIAGNWIGLAQDGVTTVAGQIGVYVGPSGRFRGLPDAPGGASDVRIGVGPDLAPTAPEARRRNVVVGHEEANLLLDRKGSPASTPILVQSNWIGLDATGEGGATASTIDAVTEVGILVTGEARARIGGAGAGNVVGGHAIGIWADADEVEVVGNRIGIDPGDGTERRSNGFGVAISGSRVKVGLQGTVPTPNVISGQDLAGAALDGNNDGTGVFVGSRDVIELFYAVARSKRADPREGALGLGLLGRAPRGLARGAETAEDNVIAYNLVGLTTDGTAAVVPTDDMAESIGIWAASGAVRTQIYANTIGGTGIGIGVARPIVEPALSTFPRDTRVAANRVGLRPVGPDDVFVPNQLAGVMVFASEGGVIGDEAVEGQGPNRIAGNGTEGSGLPPPHVGGAGVVLLHPEDAEGAPTGRHTLRRNLIWGNQGLGITRDVLYYGVTPNGEDNTDGVASFNFPRLLQVIGDGGSTFVRGASTAPMTVEVFADRPCDDSGYGEGRVYLGTVQAQNGVFEGTVSAVPFSDWRVSVTGTNSNGTTSEFSPCQPVAAPGDTASLEVQEGQTPTLEGPGLKVTVTQNPAGRGKRQVAGTLYAALHIGTADRGPEAGAFAGSAVSSDGTTVEPDDIQRQRFWTVLEDGLDGITYEACLRYDGLYSLPVPEQLLVVTRRGRGEPWTPNDSFLRTEGDAAYLCAGGLTGFGELAIGADGAVNPVTDEPEPGEAPEGREPEVFALAAYPNPAQGRAVLTVSVPQRREVRVTVHDALGRVVSVVHARDLPPGVHDLPFETAKLSPGLYLVRATSGDALRVQRLTVVR